MLIQKGVAREIVLGGGLLQWIFSPLSSTLHTLDKLGFCYSVQWVGLLLGNLLKPSLLSQGMKAQLSQAMACLLLLPN